MQTQGATRSHLGGRGLAGKEARVLCPIGEQNWEAPAIREPAQGGRCCWDVGAVHCCRGSSASHWSLGELTGGAAAAGT